MKRFRLLLLLAILALAVTYVVATDHAAPAWGMTSLLGVLVWVLGCLAIAATTWSLWRWYQTNLSK